MPLLKISASSVPLLSEVEYRFGSGGAQNEGFEKYGISFVTKSWVYAGVDPESPAFFRIAPIQTAFTETNLEFDLNGFNEFAETHRLGVMLKTSAGFSMLEEPVRDDVERGVFSLLSLVTRDDGSPFEEVVKYTYVSSYHLNVHVIDLTISAQVFNFNSSEWGHLGYTPWLQPSGISQALLDEVTRVSEDNVVILPSTLAALNKWFGSGLYQVSPDLNNANMTIHLGAGVDRLEANRVPVIAFGEEGNDTLLGSSGNDIIDGGGGKCRHNSWWRF